MKCPVFLFLLLASNIKATSVPLSGIKMNADSIPPEAGSTTLTTWSDSFSSVENDADSLQSNSTSSESSYKLEEWVQETRELPGIELNKLQGEDIQVEQLERDKKGISDTNNSTAETTGAKIVSTGLQPSLQDSEPSYTGSASTINSQSTFFRSNEQPYSLIKAEKFYENSNNQDSFGSARWNDISTLYDEGSKTSETWDVGSTRFSSLPDSYISDLETMLKEATITSDSNKDDSTHAHIGNKDLSLTGEIQSIISDASGVGFSSFTTNPFNDDSTVATKLDETSFEPSDSNNVFPSYLGSFSHAVSDEESSDGLYDTITVSSTNEQFAHQKQSAVDFVESVTSYKVPADTDSGLGDGNFFASSELNRVFSYDDNGNQFVSTVIPNSVYPFTTQVNGETTTDFFKNMLYESGVSGSPVIEPSSLVDVNDFRAKPLGGFAGADSGMNDGVASALNIGEDQFDSKFSVGDDQGGFFDDKEGNNSEVSSAWLKELTEENSIYNRQLVSFPVTVSLAESDGVEASGEKSSNMNITSTTNLEDPAGETSYNARNTDTISTTITNETEADKHFYPEQTTIDSTSTMNINSSVEIDFPLEVSMEQDSSRTTESNGRLIYYTNSGVKNQSSISSNSFADGGFPAENVTNTPLEFSGVSDSIKHSSVKSENISSYETLSNVDLSSQALYGNSDSLVLREDMNMNKSRYSSGPVDSFTPNELQKVSFSGKRFESQNISNAEIFFTNTSSSQTFSSTAPPLTTTQLNFVLEDLLEESLERLLGPNASLAPRGHLQYYTPITNKSETVTYRLGRHKITVPVRDVTVLGLKSMRLVEQKSNLDDLSVNLSVRFDSISMEGRFDASGSLSGLRKSKNSMLSQGYPSYGSGNISAVVSNVTAHCQLELQHSANDRTLSIETLKLRLTFEEPVVNVDISRLPKTLEKLAFRDNFAQAVSQMVARKLLSHIQPMIRSTIWDSVSSSLGQLTIDGEHVQTALKHLAATQY